ncbi:MAG: type II toxin-antitoxin system VapC family toxin, partial [Actinomycetes bacterium]
MTLVLDSSAVVALLVDSATAGDWVAEQVGGQELVAPDLMPFEVANVLRRLSLSGEISDQEATLAHVDLMDLPV